jgi:signal transduction histidine kinase
MRRGANAASISGARAVVALGFLYAALTAVRGYSVVTAGARLPGQLFNFLLVCVPSLALVYFGYRLPRTDVPRDVHARVAGWSVLGGGVMTVVILVVELTPGSGIEYLTLAILLFGAFGSLGGFGIGLQEARAITQAREAEQQRQETESYSRELERQNERLESYAGMLTHELRNPLNIAQIYLQQVEADREAEDERETEGDQEAITKEGQREPIDQIESALDRIEEMIDILLVTVRGSEADIDWTPVVLSEVAADAWAELSPEEATLVVESDPTIRADPVHVRHLLGNLFKNALEHGDEDVTVRIGTLESADGFYVEDDGPGIPEDVRNAVVEAGYTTKSGGIGLGLTFVANLVDTYDWDWTITESETGGARFEFSGVDIVAKEEAERQR